MLIETNCRRCGKRITTMTTPLFSSAETKSKWGGICSACMTEQEKFKMMLDMNNDIKAKRGV